MTAGLPGAGIGGLFYMLLVLLMPLCEIWRTLRGRSSVERWRSIAMHWSLAGGIMGALAAGGWAVRQGLDALVQAGLFSAQSRQTALNVATVTPTTALLIAGAILFTLLGGMALLSLFVRPSPRRLPRP